MGRQGLSTLRFCQISDPVALRGCSLGEAGVGAVCLMINTFTCTREGLGFGGRGEAKTSAGRLRLGRRFWKWRRRKSLIFPPHPGPGEICGFRLHGSGVPFEAVILDKATGEGLIRAKEPVDCEAQKEHTFTIQAYDCGEGPDGANTKKSHK